MEIRSRRLSGLEVSRGFAALSVVIFHLMVIYLPLPPSSIQKAISSFGGAVPFFFALSAFSLCFGYSEKIFSESGMRTFYTRRMFRILPLFYLMLIVHYIRENYFYQRAWPADVVINMFFLFPFFPGKHESIIWAGWSLGVECLFYLIFPVVVLLTKRIVLNVSIFLMLCLVTLAIHRSTPGFKFDHTYFSMNTPSNLIYFQAGALAYGGIQVVERLKDGTVIFGKIRSWFYPLFLLTIAILLLYRIGLPESIRADFPVAPILAVVCMIWIMLAYAGLPRLIDNKITQHFGRLSYGIYLIHPLVLWAMAEFKVFEYVTSRIPDPVFALLICAVAAVMFVIVMADFSYRLIERPAMAFGETLLRL